MRLKINLAAFIFFKITVIVFYVNISNVSVMERTDDLTLVNDLYFFFILWRERACARLLLKAKGPG